ncbi:MAG: flagellar assembly protein FliH [Rhizobiales bacterium]|nr:flagellar assembly protein FliH [Hyphomicrobiales bacterium]
MGAPAKFMFDDDFSPAGARIVRPTAAQMQAEATAAEARGHRDGLAAGRAESMRVLADAMTAAAAGIQRLVSGLRDVERRIEVEAVEVAVAVGRKLASELVAREPRAEIEALAAECFRHLIGVPHVAVRLAPDMLDAMRGRLEEMAAAEGFSGRLVILAEPNLQAGDCRIEWTDGGAVRERAAIEQAIATAVESYLSVRRGPPDMQSGV